MPPEGHRQSRSCILVLGMHRSGTSAVSRVLGFLGATLPRSLLPAGHGNPSGHWEPARLVELNDAYLQETGSAWHDSRARPSASLPPTRRAHYVDRIASLIVDEYGSADLMVLKDPRICRLLPLYHDALDQLGIRAAQLLVTRHPASVAASLQRRDGVLPEYGTLLWLRHVLDAERTSRGRPRSHVDIDAIARDWAAEMTRVADELIIRWPNDPLSIAGQVEGFLDRDRLLAPIVRAEHGPIGAVAAELHAGMTRRPAVLNRRQPFARAERQMAVGTAVADAVHRELKRREAASEAIQTEAFAEMAAARASAEDEIARSRSAAVELTRRLEQALIAQDGAQRRVEEALEARARLEAEAATYGARIGRVLTRTRRRLAPSGSLRHLALQHGLAGLERLRRPSPAARPPHPQVKPTVEAAIAPAPAAGTAAPRRAISRAYVVAAHYPSGGGRMLYGIAEVLATEFGAEVIVVDVGGEAHAPDRFSYPLALPSIDVDGYRAAAREDDLLVMSPAFSHLWLGRTAPRRKLMYLQHFNTFRVLDTFFSDYVCVSRHTRDMLRATYGIRAQVIPAFIEPVAQAPPDWTERPDGRVLVNLKGDRGLNMQLLEEIRSGLAARGVAAEFVDPVQGGVQHAELMRTLGNHRYLLTLTESEGFGLLPLEAMARGVAVVGFDGFGGRDYMRQGRNSLCHPFPQVDRVIDSLTLLLTDASRARAIALAGQQTARGFNRARFRSAWHRALDALVQ